MMILMHISAKRERKEKDDQILPQMLKLLGFDFGNEQTLI